MHVLVTGAAGFIGFHLSKRLSAEGHTVVGIDNLNDYYSVQLKKDRLAQLQALPGFTFEHTDLADDAALEAVFVRNAFSHVVNLAAQAGVPITIMNMGRTQYDRLATRLIRDDIAIALPQLVDETIAAEQGK